MNGTNLRGAYSMTAYLDKDRRFKLSECWTPSRNTILFKPFGESLKIVRGDSTIEFVSVKKLGAYKEEDMTMSLFSAEAKDGGTVGIRILLQDGAENLFKHFSYLYLDYKSSVNVYPIIMEKK
ncbi:MAG: hypothetical protein IPL84_08635 [Chitinophagaceae bacterium]|nr:hypothetical protein [Chitinophagaceae bacterium]